MMPQIPNDRLIDQLFRVRRFEYSTYEVDHTDVRGTVRIANVPINILQIPNELVPLQARGLGIPQLAISGQVIVSFLNRGRKGTPSTAVFTQEQLQQRRRVDLTRFVLQEQSFEPWNEYVIQGEPPIVVSLRTILTRLEWFPELTNFLGDPFLWAFQNTNQNVTMPNAGEAGLT